MTTTATKLRTVRIAHSPDSDDAFMFYALTQGLLDDSGLDVSHELRDIETQTRRDLKNTRFPVLKLPASRTPKDRRVLEEQVRGNRKLFRAMLLKDDFMDLYTYQREGWARRFLDGWLRRAMYSKIEPIKKVARMIRNHLDGVVGWVRWQISNGRLEGMNNRVRLLSHRSFGLHSADALISLVYLCCGGLQLQTIHGK